MHDLINNIMYERNVDRSSVMKLALFHFHNFLQEEDNAGLAIEELLERINSKAADPQKLFHHYGVWK